MGSRGIYHDGWMASTFGPRTPWVAQMPDLANWDPMQDEWQLFDTRKDYSLMNDVASEHPEKLEELKALFMKEADDNKALPIGGALYTGLNPQEMKRSTNTEWTLYQGMTRIPEREAPNVRNGNLRAEITATVPANVNGVIFAMGGYAGGPEGTAVVTVATALQDAVFLQAHYHMCFPIHYIHLCNTTRDLLWVISTVGQAISSNTRLPVTIAGELDSGPCTDMVLLEAAAYSSAGTVSGLSLMAVEVTNNKCLDHCTGMEARMAAEVGHAVAESGLKREDANELVKDILKRYEGRIGQAPLGKSFRECYDAETITPTKEYLDIYDDVKRELENIGLET